MISELSALILNKIKSAFQIVVSAFSGIFFEEYTVYTTIYRHFVSSSLFKQSSPRAYRPCDVSENLLSFISLNHVF